MNLKHLGDAMDAWKGWLVHIILPSLRDMKVVPMLTDAGKKWNHAKFRLYAQTLHLPTASIMLKTKKFTHTGRKKYFQGMPRMDKCTDVFLDPDTGVWKVKSDSKARKTKMEKGKKRDVSHRYVRTGEIANLLPDKSDRVILIYRQGRESMNDLCKNLKSYAQAIGNRCWAIGVRGGSVTVVLFSNSKPRLNRIRHLLLSVYGPVRADRVSPLLHK